MKKIVGALLIIAVLGVCWFLFIKEYDYQFKFNGKFGPSTVYREIQRLENFEFDDAPYPIKTVDSNAYKNLKQKVLLGNGNSIILDWNFYSVNDTVTNIVVNSRLGYNRFAERLQILNPFIESEYVSTLKGNLQDFNKSLKARQNFYKITLDSLGKNHQMTCACVTSTTSIDNKAVLMMTTMNKLQEFILLNDLELQGQPVLKVVDWDRKKNDITFDFCFPINNSERIEETEVVKIKQIKSQESLKAVYHGNYRNSQLAWLELLEKARRENIAVENHPLEIYFNNPGMGGEEIKWKTEIFLPLK